MRQKRVVPPQDEQEAQLMALAIPEAERDEDISAPDPPGPFPDTGAGSVDRYLESQVNREIYGTDAPTDYERRLQALRQML